MMRWFRKPRPRVLLVSMALNLFFVGLIGAAIASGPLGRPPAPFRHMMKAAGAEARPVIEKAMARHEPELKAAAKALRAAEQDVRAAMVAETVDVAQLRRALDERYAARRRLSKIMEDAYVEALPVLSLETRTEMAERRRHRKKRRHD